MNRQRSGFGASVAAVMSVLAIIAALWAAAYHPCRIQKTPAQPSMQEEAVDPIASLPVRLISRQIAASRYADEPGFPAPPTTVPLSELYDLPPAKDAIEALVNPPVIAAEQADWLGDDDMVLGVMLYDRHTAYPRNILARHCAINNSLADTPIVVYFDPPSGASMALQRPTQAGSVLEFGVSGIGYAGMGLLFDRLTESLWYPASGRAITGPMSQKTAALEPIRAEWMTWGAWRKRWPDTTVLSADTGAGYDYEQDPYAHVAFGAHEESFDYYHSDILLAPDRLRTPGDDPGDKEMVLGISLPRGTVAVPVAEAFDAPSNEDEGLTHATRWGQLRLDVDAASRHISATLPGNWRPPQARMFWFAWKAAHPATKVWHIGGTGDEE